MKKLFIIYFSFLVLFSGAASAFACDEENQRPVPEPATMTLLGMGLAGLVLSKNRKK